MNKKEPVGLKNIYKKSLAMELIKRGNNFSHSMRNFRNPKFQVWVFEHTPKLIVDLVDLTTNKPQDY